MTESLKLLQSLSVHFYYQRDVNIKKRSIFSHSLALE